MGSNKGSSATINLDFTVLDESWDSLNFVCDSDIKLSFCKTPKVDPAQNVGLAMLKKRFGRAQFVDDFLCQLSAGIHPRILSSA